MGEMTALEYLQEKSRMTRGCGVFCDNCPLGLDNNGKDVMCGGLEEGFPETAISIVQKWAEEHPRKTILQDFLEKYPKAILNSDKTPNVCPFWLGYGGKYCEHNHNCSDCWNRPLEEE